MTLPASPAPSTDPCEPPPPMVIDFQKLSVKPAPANSVASAGSQPPKASLPIVVRSPNVLKVVLLQACEATGNSAETKPMDLISLSGVALQNVKGEWQLQEGANFHDPLPPDCSDHTETFPLPGGIRVIYNHTHKRWHVLPPPPPLLLSATPLTSSLELRGEPHLTGAGVMTPEEKHDVERLVRVCL